MNKVEFLDALHRRIDMLDDAEVSDILNEYSLHIECKVQCGMTEEEAVADFGDVGELAADVLSAYHVKAPAEPVAAVASAQSDKESSSTGPASELEHNAGAVKAAWEYLCSLCKRGVQGVRDWCSRCLCACKSVGDRLFSRRCKADDALGVDPYAADVDSSAPSVEAVAAGVGAAAGPLPAADSGRPHSAARNAVGGKRPGSRSLGAAVASGCRSGGRATLRFAKAFWGFCKGVMWVCLALAFGFAALMCACAAAFLVFSFGLALVLAATGYPLWGTMLALLGGSAMALAVTVLLFNFVRWHVWPRRKADKDASLDKAVVSHA